MSYYASAQCQTIRDYTIRLELKIGNYILEPKTTFGTCANCASDLMLRIFSDDDIDILQLNPNEHDLVKLFF